MCKIESEIKLEKAFPTISLSRTSCLVPLYSYRKVLPQSHIQVKLKQIQKKWKRFALTLGTEKWRKTPAVNVHDKLNFYNDQKVKNRHIPRLLT